MESSLMLKLALTFVPLNKFQKSLESMDLSVVFLKHVLLSEFTKIPTEKVKALPLTHGYKDFET